MDLPNVPYAGRAGSARPNEEEAMALDRSAFTMASSRFVTSALGAGGFPVLLSVSRCQQRMSCQCLPKHSRSLCSPAAKASTSTAAETTSATITSKASATTITSVSTTTAPSSTVTTLKSSSSSTTTKVATIAAPTSTVVSTSPIATSTSSTAVRHALLLMFFALTMEGRVVNNELRSTADGLGWYVVVQL